MSINHNPITNTYILDGNGSTDKVIEELRGLIERGKIVPDKFNMSTLRYNAHVGLGRENAEDFYPLKFISETTQVWLSSVTAGYGGTGPHGTVEALKLMGFKVDDRMKMIIFFKKVTDEIFSK